MDATNEDDPLYDPDRVAIHELLSSFGGPDDGIEGLLAGWVCVAEWMLPSGLRTLTFLNADANGNPAPSWQTVGYLRNALSRCEPVVLVRQGSDDGDEE